MIEYILAITLICFFIGAWFRIKNKEYGSDEYYHLMVADEIRKNKFRLPKDYDWVIEAKGKKPEEFDYPPIFLYLLAFFPNKIITKYRQFISPFFNALSCLMLMLFLSYLTKNVLAVVIGGMLYSITPAVYHQTYNLNPRVLGVFLFNVTLLLTWLFLAKNELIFLILAIISFSFIVMTHKFSTQAATFSMLFLSIFYGFNVLIIPIAGISLTIILMRKYYFKMLRGHIAIVNFWTKHINEFTVGKIYNLNFKQRVLDFIKKIALNLWILLIPVLFFQNNLLFFVYATISVLAVIGLTATKIFGGLGDYIRYYDFTVFPIMIPLAIYVSGNLNTTTMLAVIGIILINCITIYSLFKRASKINEGALNNKELEELIKFLGKRKEKNLFFIPTSDEARTIRYKLDKKFPNPESPTKFEKTVQDGVYFRIDRNVKKNCKKYGFELVVCTNDYLKNVDLDFAKKVYSNKKYSVFEVPKKFR